VKGEFLPLMGIGSWSSISEVVTVPTELSSEFGTQIIKYMKYWYLCKVTWHDWTGKWENYLTWCFLKCSFHVLFVVV